MLKYIILEPDNTFVLVVHACPNEIGKFQWYIVEDPNSEHKQIIDNQIYESITIASKTINNKYQNKWLCCECEVNNEKYIEGCIYLSNNFTEMIKTNQFDEVNFFDKHGNIRKDIGYTGPVISSRL